MRFDSTKAIEAAAVIARRDGKRLGRMRLLKLLYIADRTAIQSHGHPILGSKSVAMDHGPLHSDVYDMIKGDHPASPRWSRFFTCPNPRDVILTDEPENLTLSKSDIEILHTVVDKYCDVDDWNLSKMTHEFKEWDDAYQEGTSRPISLESIVEGVGRGNDKDSILKDIADDEAFDKFFERHTQ